MAANWVVWRAAKRAALTVDSMAAKLVVWRVAQRVGKMEKKTVASMAASTVA